MTEPNKTIAYKGFNKDLKCRGFQYEVGKEYHHTEKIVLCESGFHACPEPIEVFDFYAPGISRFCEVEASGEIVTEENKIACENLKVIRELSIGEFVGIATDHKMKTVLANLVNGTESATGDQSASSATGDRSASSATGYQSASSATGNRSASSATGDQSASSATGYRSASSATGYQSASFATGDQSASSATSDQSAAVVTGTESNATVAGKESIACGFGYKCKAKAEDGSWIALVERNDIGEILHAKFAKAGVDIKPDTFYTLVNGEFVEEK